MDHLVSHGDAGDGRLDLCSACKRLHIAHLIGGHDGDDHALGSGTGRAATAVQVGLVLGRRVDVHDQRDLVHVDATSSDVGGHEYLRRPLGEGLQVALACILREVAVQFHCRDASHRELLGQLLRPVLGAGEQQRPFLASGQGSHHVGLVGLCHGEHVVGHRADRSDRRVHGVDDRVDQVALHENVDAVVERGGEQQALAGGGRGVHQPLHAGQEAEVGHVVGLVEHCDLHMAERAEALLDEVFEAPGAGDDDVDALLQCLHLRLLADATEDGGDAQAHGGGQGSDGLGDLVGEFTCGHQHHAARLAGVLGGGAGSGQRGYQWDAEGDGLAAARATAAQHVAASHGVGKCGGLNGERGGDAAVCKGLHDRCRYAE